MEQNVSGEALWTFLDDVFNDVLDEARAHYEKLGVHLGEVSEILDYGVYYNYITFKYINVDFDSSWVREWLSGDSSWNKIYDAIALENLMGEEVSIYEYITDFEVYWSPRYGICVRLELSAAIDDLLEKYNLGDVETEDLELAIEALIDEVIREIVSEFNGELEKFYKLFPSE